MPERNHTFKKQLLKKSCYFDMLGKLEEVGDVLWP